MGSLSRCPECDRLWFHTLNGSGCLTPGCAHSLIGERRRPKTRKHKTPETPNPRAPRIKKGKP
jgi:hypothetical protein